MNGFPVIYINCHNGANEKKFVWMPERQLWSLKKSEWAIAY
jgi:hypothetical protein